MGIYVKTDTFLDTFTDSSFLKEHLPEVRESYDIAKGWRDFHHQNQDKGMWGSELKHVASINPNVGMVAMDFHWNIFDNPKTFHAWLAKHPECKATK